VIRMGLHSLPLLYAAGLLSVVLLVWLVTDWRRSRRRRRERRDLFQCRLCAGWIRHGGQPSTLVRCASCGALNERGRGSDL
jgi:Flp pilus assembly protein TadB